MKEAIYLWMKTLAFYYLLFSVFLNLVPDSSYEKYIRFFMGLLLILLFCMPLFSLIGKHDAFFESFSVLYENEIQVLEQQAQENWERMEAELLSELERNYRDEMENLWNADPLPETGTVDDFAPDRAPSGSVRASGY